MRDGLAAAGARGGRRLGVRRAQAEGPVLAHAPPAGSGGGGVVCVSGELRRGEERGGEGWRCC